MKTSIISLAATLLLAASVCSASTREVKYSAVNVNGNWYYCGQEMSWCKGGAFNQANLGIITSLELGGQSQVSTGNDWGGGTMTMGYSFDGGSANYITLTYYGYTGTYNQLQSGGNNYSNTPIDISSLSNGKHTIAVWFQSEDAYDSNNMANYVASFTKMVWKGEGTEDSPYLIESTGDLDALAISVNNGNGYSEKHLQLVNDLNYENKSYTPIGTEDSPFEGNFDGNGNKISNITINEPNKDYIGVFGYLSGYSSYVENLKLSDCTFIGNNYVGGIAGYAGGGISCCFNNNVSVSGKNTVGGIAGYFSDYMSECRHSGSVSGTKCKIGGIVGNNEGTIAGCYCDADITGVGNADMLGGIAGSLGESGYIENCIYEGIITGNSGSSIGGIIGEMSDQYEAPRRKRATARTNSDEFIPLMRNYYVASGVKGIGNGYEDFDIIDNDGAVPAYKYEEIPFSLGNPVPPEYPGIRITTYLNCLYYNGHYYFGFVPLYNSGENETALERIKDLNLDLHRFQILSRTLYKTGDWNTLCLPFSLGDNDPDDDLTFSGTPLEGAIVKTLESSNLSDDGTLTLNFSEDNLTSIVAGKAYIVKWEGPEDFEEYPEYYEDNPEYEIYNPVFTDVTITAIQPDNPFSNDFDYIFQGNFDPYRLTPGNQTELYLGANNTLYYPSENSNVTIGAFRGYFKYAQTGTGSTPIKSFVLNFGDEENGIKEITTDSNLSNSSNTYFSLDGLRLLSQPVTPGIYIHNGRKVLIK